MKNCRHLKSLFEIADLYDIFFIDLWGVIHNGVAVFQNVIPVLENYKKKIKQFFLLLMLQDDHL